MAKEKTVAIVLSIFFSFFTWLYTFEKNKMKFFIGLGVSMFGIFLLFLPNIGIHIWAFVDTLITPEEDYKKMK